MKSHSKFLIKVTAFSILLFGIVFGIFAREKHSDCPAINDNLSKHKVTPKIQKAEDQKNIEEWMLDPNFREIKSTFEWEQEPTEEPAQLEEWMIDLFKQNIEKADLFNGFVEKDWMKKHSFYIL